MVSVIVIISVAMFGAFLIFELATAAVLGTKYIYGRGNKYLGEELENIEWLKENRSLNLHGQSLLNGRFISIMSCITSKYYINCKGDLDYRILRFSKAHYMIEAKYKELAEKSPKHLTF